MRRPVCALLLALILPFSLGGCALAGKIFKGRKKVEKDNVPHDLFIGTIESVNPEQHFVLIHTMMRVALKPGSKLETRPVGGTKATLVVTPEQKLNFLSADITEGFPQRGDAVVLPPQLMPDSPSGGGNVSPPAGTLPPPIH